MVRAWASSRFRFRSVPYFQKKQEDEFWVKERYDRAPILGPLTEGGPDTAMDPPSDDEVMRTFERALPQQGGIAVPV